MADDRTHPEVSPVPSRTLRKVAGSVLIFLAFVASARVFLVSDAPARPGLWLLGSAFCAGAAWLLLRNRAPGG